MKKLTYNNSSIYHDNTSITWKPDFNHTGYVNGKAKFIIYEHSQGSEVCDRHLQMIDENGDKIIIGKPFHESMLWNELYRKDKEEALKPHNMHYLSLRACQQLAEDTLHK